MTIASPVEAPDPASAPPVRWGIVGVGWMADKFTSGIRDLTRSTVVAVCSRSQERAEAFAASHGVARAYDSVDALVADPDVDVVHVASPHSEHRTHALAAIAAGKHVLVEKAFTRNEVEARDVIDAARKAGVFVMEAMWTRFLPHVVEIKRTIARGDIGRIVALEADHGQWFPFDRDSRLWSPDLAGGALLDLGVYPVSFAHDFLGVPETIAAVGQLTETGVDGQVSIVLGYGERAQATLYTTLWSATPCTAVISGTEGRIEIEGHFYAPTSYRVVRRDGMTWSVEARVPNGYAYEAAEVARRVTAGEMESPAMMPEGTIEVMRTLDEVRRQIGLVYPGE
ncbi:MAG: Gfo/Idh/MocA family oxidoreductase [Demequinaceae bacterium]|nr:Gfo/Idh/MocA family oxidoreductase [Demequinaceae bacterium]